MVHKQAARRLDIGGYTVLKSFATKPIRSELDELFFEDSKIRDKDLSLMDRMRRLIPKI